MNDMKRRIRYGAWTLLCMCVFGLMGLTTRTATASGPLLPLAQAAPAPATPSNIKKVERMYVVESVVIVLLFGGAIYGVCRTSRRT